MAILDSYQLTEPVTEEDVIDHEEYVDSLQHSQLALRDRILHQVGPCPLVDEMTYIAQILELAAQRLSALRAQGCFPRIESSAPLRA
jgi:hypothetical protein